LSLFNKKHPPWVKNNQSEKFIEKMFDEDIPTLYYAPPLSFEEKEVRVKSVSSAAW
jgi:hypothetical protein|tara:strand:+ start:1755 stop:1922 length:168 start_codon:yes stop_codon:yes gene_type:complete